MNSNFRRHLLSLSLLVGVAAPWAATAQAPISNVGSGSVEDRVTSLERISNAQGQLLNQLQQQLSDNQRDIDSLRGQIQESQYQLNQVVERQKQIYQQMDSLSQGGAQAPLRPRALPVGQPQAHLPMRAAARLQPLLQRRAAVMRTATTTPLFLWRWKKNSMTRRFPPFSPS